MCNWYSLRGKVEVRLSPEVERMVGAFNDLGRGITAEPGPT